MSHRRNKMSFERFSSSDIYMFEHVSGFIQCCGCWLDGDYEGNWSVELRTPREALAHLDRHEAAGHDIGGARNRIIKEYPDLDIEIQPYKRTEEEKIIHRKLMDDIKARFAAYEHPPQEFRDRSNGE
jgi:hypothetical protein